MVSKQLETHLESVTKESAEKIETKLPDSEKYLEHLTHFLRADYYLCKAEWTLLSQDQNLSQDTIITKCKKYLEQAKNELFLRVLEFFRIGEISQGNLSPLFNYWAKIYAFEGRLSLFFPVLFNKLSSVGQLFDPLVFFGNARINAARDGNSFLSFQMALYQSWCYLMQAYIGDRREGFEKTDCIEWAEKLLDYALIGYKEDSSKIYQEYMQAIFSEYDNGHYEEFGENLKIKEPPFIRLINNYIQPENPSPEKNDREYKISSRLIKRKLLNSSANSSENNTIDLFGQYSSLYFYVLAMFELCNDYPDETKEDIRNHFEDAFDYFFCALSMSFGGAEIKKIGEEKKLERNCNCIEFKHHDTKELHTLKEDKLNVSALKGLYLHRIIELVDLSKIFAALTKSIIAKSEDDLEEGKSFLWENEKSIGILTNVSDDFELISNQQEYYNIHLQGQFKRIKSYLIDDCLSNLPNLNSEAQILDCRNQRVGRVFRYLRGD